MSHLDNYLDIVKLQSSSLRDTVEETSNAVYDLIANSFDYKSHLTGLLLGNVQSGKTAQLLGAISKLADKGFEIFILLSTDNVFLQKQTQERTKSALRSFNVYGEEDDLPFLSCKVDKPIIVILKKNTHILRKWRNLYSSSGYCSGRPLVIIDDESDAASLNTLVNKNKVSTINKHLNSIKNLSTSSIFIQVTATPQAILLQSNISGWKPSFIYYFKPGSEYIGGDFIYSQPKSYCIEFANEDELDEVRNEDSVIPEGLRTALISFLVVCGHSYKQDITTCNFLVHPSVRIADHVNFSTTLGEHLNLVLLSINDESEKELLIVELRSEWLRLQKTKPDIVNFEDVLEAIIFLIENELIKIIVLNSTSPRDINYDKGYNIIVGGNSLGRGVTFPRLQTVYYSRRSKSPQADTFWQHSRMFGYDRDKGLLRVFLPPSLYSLFSELNISNKLLINQVLNNDINSIQLIYPENIKPTRAAVLDKKALNLIVGGVNFFASNPIQNNQKELDHLLLPYDESSNFYYISSNFMIELLNYVGDEENQDWNNTKYSNAVQALSLKRPLTKYALIFRKGRDIGKSTGTLLSPTDRKLGEDLHDCVVLTLYGVNGSQSKGWKGNPFFIPNIKFPDGVCIYDTIDI